jgi:adenosine deaminase
MMKFPKSTLHVHLEATVTPEIAQKLHPQKYPEALVSKEDATKWHFPNKNFGEFLNCYDKVTNMLSIADMEVVAYQYLKRCHQQGVIYAELGISPDHFRANRQDYSTSGGFFSASTKSSIDDIYLRYVNILERVILKAKAKLGIEARIRIVLIRHVPESCMPLVRTVLANPHPLVVGFDLAGDEIRYPATAFEKEYDLITQYNKRAKYPLGKGAHAGEHSDAESILKAIETLGLQRVGHGVACMSEKDINPIKHAEIMASLQSSKVGFEVCPASNIALALFKNYSEHAVKPMIDAGLPVTFGDDDPVFIGFSEIGPEYEKIQSEFNYSDEKMLEFTRNAISMAFCCKELKDKLFLQINAYQKYAQISAILSADFQDENVSKAFTGYIESPNLSTLMSLSAAIKGSEFKVQKLQDLVAEQVELVQKIEGLDTSITQTLKSRINDFNQSSVHTDPQLSF